MSRRYNDPVDVRRRDEDPTEFLWRGRFYAVREVLARWVETGSWWQGTSESLGEREVWRVEASAGRVQGTGVFDLCFDWTAGGWTLLCTQD